MADVVLEAISKNEQVGNVGANAFLATRSQCIEYGMHATE